MAVAEICEPAETEVPINKAKLATEKYRNYKHWFWAGLVREPVLFTVATVLSFFNAILGVMPSILIGLGIDELRAIQTTGEPYQLTSRFMFIVIAIFVVAVITWVVSFIGSYSWSLASFRIERDIRQEFFEVIQEHSMAFHDERDSGVLLSMGMNEIGQIRRAYQPSIRMLFNTILNITITCSYFFVRFTIGTEVIGVGYWPIGLGISLSFVLYFILAWRYASKISPIRKRLATELGDLSAASQEVFRGIEVVRSFDNEKKEEEKFRQLSERYSEAVKQEGFLSSFYWPSVLIILSTAAAFTIGIWLIPQGDITTGQLATMLTLLFRLILFNFMVPMRLLMLQAGLTNAERVWNVMTYDDPMAEPKEPLKADWSKELQFKNVSFKYPGTDRYVLQNLAFTIPPGSRVALIGGPGSGKSTILKLLLRLYDPTEGDIILNGCRFRDMTTPDVREDVTLVEQDIFLFSASIRENIAFAKPDATDEEIKEAAKRAQAASFIEATPDGYDTPISERGVTLSGGQRQRIAIARALLADPKLLLLDDSTSAVDIKTEARLRLAMEELIAGRTSIIVTQRLSVLVESDMIIFLDKGEIVDIGTHEELVERCQPYQFMLKHLPSGEEELSAATVTEYVEQKTAGGT
ncbi:MAG: ABC transporter ATP-binding protein [Asgard group archaeon]|nr:ABC transporter ATP-binding protein [Asgard group archaeon]